MHITTAFKAAVEASAAIMDIYNGTVSASYKSDGSPVTEADKQADAIIRKHLKPTGIPVISEESDLLPYEERKSWSTLWLVDPLDGTKEFLKRNGEFTVNIALIENGHPIMGIITAPFSGKGWIGAPGLGAYLVDTIYDKSLTDEPEHFLRQLTAIKPTSSLASAGNTLRFALSRSHPDNLTEGLIKQLRKQGKEVSKVPRGSSLKLCDIVTNRADIYTRFGPTNEWDIAAGHALLNAVGGDVVDMQTGKPLTYNKPDMLNPYFVASNGKLPGELLSIIRQWSERSPE